MQKYLRLVIIIDAVVVQWSVLLDFPFFFFFLRCVGSTRLAVTCTSNYLLPVRPNCQLLSERKIAE